MTEPLAPKITHMQNLKLIQVDVYSKTEAASQIQKTKGYQWGEGKGGRDWGRGLRDTNYHI